MNWKWKLAQAAEIRWWRYYLAKKSPDKYLNAKRAYWLRLMEQTGIEAPARALILDAGCGPAGIFIVLKQQQVDAIDPLLERYAAQLPHFRPEKYPNVRFIPSDLESFLPQRSYDQIFCLNAINHVADIDRALDQLVGCLAPHGKLWLSIDTHRFRFFQRLFRWIPGDILHPHQYDLEAYEKMLTGRGLTVARSVKLKAGRIFDYHLIEAGFDTNATSDKFA